MIAKELRSFLRLVRLVEKKVAAEEKLLGDELARDIIGPKATYASAQRAFASVIHSEQLYPTKRKKREA